MQYAERIFKNDRMTRRRQRRHAVQDLLPQFLLCHDEPFLLCHDEPSPDEPVAPVTVNIPGPHCAVLGFTHREFADSFRTANQRIPPMADSCSVRDLSADSLLDLLRRAPSHVDLLALNARSCSDPFFVAAKLSSIIDALERFDISLISYYIYWSYFIECRIKPRPGLTPEQCAQLGVVLVNLNDGTTISFSDDYDVAAHMALLEKRPVPDIRIPILHRGDDALAFRQFLSLEFRRRLPEDLLLDVVIDGRSWTTRD